MTQYNLRLDKVLKSKASTLAKSRGLSENSLYQMAIEEFIAKTEAIEFYQKLIKRAIPSSEKNRILKKLKANRVKPLFPEDER